MLRDPRALLWDVCSCADSIAHFTLDLTGEDYANNAIVRAAVERQFEIIGEALGKLRKSHPEIASEIPDLNKAISLRNILIHGYAVIQDAMIWRIVQEDLPALRLAAATLLAGMPGVAP